MILFPCLTGHILGENIYKSYVWLVSTQMCKELIQLNSTANKNKQSN